MTLSFVPLPYKTAEQPIVKVSGGHVAPGKLNKTNNSVSSKM